MASLASSRLPYQPENNDIPVEHPPTGFDTLRTIAVSRAYLDNFDHITAYWVGMGLKLAQSGVEFLAQTICMGRLLKNTFFHMAGAKSPQLQTETEMIKAIREAGRTPVQRNTFLRTNQGFWKIRLTPTALKVSHVPRCLKIIWQQHDGRIRQNSASARSVISTPTPLTRGIEDQVVFCHARQTRRNGSAVMKLDAALVSLTEVCSTTVTTFWMALPSRRWVRFTVWFLAHRVPLEKITEVFYDTASLTSVNLLKVLLAERGLKPEFKPTA